MIRLHMIENRMKLEKQIYLGRQYVRKVLRGHAVIQEQPSSIVNTQELISNLRAPSLSIDPPQPGSDLPMSVDTDAETAFRRGSHWFFKKGRDHETTSGSATLNDRLALDATCSSTLRRKRVVEVPEVMQKGSSSSLQTSPPSYAPSNPKHKSGSLISRLRARSFPNLTYPLPADSNPGSENLTNTEERRSSDSSSDDDLIIEDRRQLRRSSTPDIGPLDPTSGDV
ncbi:hypothetical protein C0992_002179 [Termitomyces sp. T32_za158]|nr:hypothetical protein C0992_002179 [Termitomyces sp. T32_za158]